MIFLIFLGIVFILIGCSALTIYIIFEKFPQFTEKTGATLRERKHKKDAFILVINKFVVDRFYCDLKIAFLNAEDDVKL